METKFVKKTTLLFVVLISAMTIKVKSQTWTLMDSTFSQSLDDIDFYDDNTGTISRGYVLNRTTNGAATWGTDVVINWEVKTLKYYGNSSTIFFGASNGTIWKSTNGGTNWSQIGSYILSDITSMTFNGSNGIAVDNNCHIGWSSDGGETWTKIPNTALCGNLSSMGRIEMPSSTVAYAGGNNRNVFKSTDGGKTWAKITTLPVNFVSVNGMSFANTEVGYIAGTVQSSSDHMLIKTTDGGTTWTDISSGLSKNISNVFAVSANTIYAGAGSNKIYKSTDGGTTWSVVFTHPTCTQCGIKEFELGNTTLFAIFGGGGSHKKVAKLANAVVNVKEEKTPTVHRIVPNPGNGKFVIEDEGSFSKVEIYTILGEKVFSDSFFSTLNEIDLSEQPNGIYFLLFQSEKSNYISKIVIQK